MRVASPLLTTSVRALAGHCGSWSLHTLEVPILEATFIGSEAATAALYLPQPSAFVAPASDHVPPGHVPLLMGCPSLRRPRRPLHGSNESGMFSPATAGRSSGRCQPCCGSASACKPYHSFVRDCHSFVRELWDHFGTYHGLCFRFSLRSSNFLGDRRPTLFVKTQIGNCLLYTSPSPRD